MQSITFENHNSHAAVQLKSENQYSPRRRDSMKCRTVFAAIQEWELTLYTHILGMTATANELWFIARLRSRCLRNARRC